MTAHHKRSDCGSGLDRPSYNPHAGPVVGDASYRLHFPDPESFRAAMALDATLAKQPAVKTMRQELGI